MVLSYDVILSEFLSMIDDKKFLTLDESDANAMMNGWLKTTLSDSYVLRLFNNKRYDNESRLFTFELRHPNKDDEQGDMDFVTKLLATGMLISWLQPKVTSTTNINQMYGGKEEKFYSQSNHLEQLRQLLSDSQLGLRKMIRDRGYIHNSYIGGDE